MPKYIPIALIYVNHHFQFR